MKSKLKERKDKENRKGKTCENGDWESEEERVKKRECWRGRRRECVLRVKPKERRDRERKAQGPSIKHKPTKALECAFCTHHTQIK